jgi:hypothetical protein
MRWPIHLHIGFNPNRHVPHEAPYGSHHAKPIDGVNGKTYFWCHWTWSEGGGTSSAGSGETWEATCFHHVLKRYPGSDISWDDTIIDGSVDFNDSYMCILVETQYLWSGNVTVKHLFAFCSLIVIAILQKAWVYIIDGWHFIIYIRNCKSWTYIGRARRNRARSQQ